MHLSKKISKLFFLLSIFTIFVPRFRRFLARELNGNRVKVPNSPAAVTPQKASPPLIYWEGSDITPEKSEDLPGTNALDAYGE